MEALSCSASKGAHDKKFADQAAEELSFIVKIFKLSLKESNSFLNSTILLGLRGLTQELILKLFSINSTSERGELWQEELKALCLSHLPSQHQCNAEMVHSVTENLRACMALGKNHAQYTPN